MNSFIRKVIDYESRYLVTRDGRIISIKGKRIKRLTPIKNSKGYLTVNLSASGVRNQKRIHRLVAEAFIPNPENKPEVNHINGDKADNRVENLEWCTMKENINHAVKLGLYKRKLTDENVRKIRSLHLAGEQQLIIARMFGVCQSMINNIVHGRYYPHVPDSEGQAEPMALQA